MTKFPTSQNQILALANQMIAGYKAHAGDFPNIVWGLLYVKYLICKATRRTQIEAQSVLRLATEAKRESLDSLKQLMKGCLEKSAVDATGNPEKLALIGWGPKALPQPVEVPGQPTELRIIAQGSRTVLFGFDRPATGGPVRNYIIERRHQSAGSAEFGAWHIAGTALNNQINLTGQPRGVQLEYHVKAANLSGESIPTNTINAVL